MRRAWGVEIWAALRSLGRAGVAVLIARTCRHARRFAIGLADAGYNVRNIASRRNAAQIRIAAWVAPLLSGEKIRPVTAAGRPCRRYAVAVTVDREEVPP